MRSLCVRVNIPERTNHIARSNAATRLAENGVPLHIIQNQTNHRSTSSLKAYIDKYV